MAKHLGVDGCPAGWFATWLDDSSISAAAASGSASGALTASSAKLRCEIYPTLSELIVEHPDAERVLVDIPIGLLRTETRQVEAAVRQRVGPRRSSVFSVPCFDAVYAVDYERANAVNRVQLGKGLSKQAWYLGAKIRDVNDFLTANNNARAVVGECHPELAFATLNQTPLIHSKKTAEGVEQRIKILERAIHKHKRHKHKIHEHKMLDVRTFLKDCKTRYKRKELIVDDVLDALALLVTATQAAVLDTPDETGEGDIPIKMWLPRISAL